MAELVGVDPGEPEDIGPRGLEAIVVVLRLDLGQDETELHEIRLAARPEVVGRDPLARGRIGQVGLEDIQRREHAPELLRAVAGHVGLLSGTGMDRNLHIVVGKMVIGVRRLDRVAQEEGLALGKELVVPVVGLGLGEPVDLFGDVGAHDHLPIRHFAPVLPHEPEGALEVGAGRVHLLVREVDLDRERLDRVGSTPAGGRLTEGAERPLGARRAEPALEVPPRLTRDRRHRAQGGTGDRRACSRRVCGGEWPRLEAEPCWRGLQGEQEHRP